MFFCLDNAVNKSRESRAINNGRGIPISLDKACFKTFPSSIDSEAAKSSAAPTDLTARFDLWIDQERT